MHAYRSERKPTVLCWRWNIFVLEDLWNVRTKCSAFFLFNPRKGHIAGFHIPREGQNLPLVWVIRFSLESARQLLDNSTGLDPERKPCLLKWNFEYHELFSWFQVSPWELRGDKLNHVVASTAWTKYRTPWVHGPIPCFIQVRVCVLFGVAPLPFTMRAVGLHCGSLQLLSGYATHFQPHYHVNHPLPSSQRFRKWLLSLDAQMLFMLGLFMVGVASLKLGLFCKILWIVVELLGPMYTVDNLVTS